MYFFIKLLYSTLFVALAWLLYLLLVDGRSCYKVVLLKIALVTACIITLAEIKLASQFVPAEEIFFLLKFDAGLLIAYSISKYQQSLFKRRASPHLLNTSLYETVDKAFILISTKGIFIMTGVYQLVSIWLMTQDYLIQARWH